MSDSESESRSSSVRSDVSEEFYGVRVSIETARFNSILQSFNEIASKTFFLFTEKTLIMFPQNLTVGESESKKEKGKKNLDDKNYNNPRVVCIFEPKNIHYHFNASSDIFISFETKTIIDSLRQYEKKDFLEMEISDDDHCLLQYTCGAANNTMSSITSIRGNSVDSGIYQPIDVSEYSEPKVTFNGNEKDLKNVMSGISGSTARSHIDCFLRVYPTGFTVEYKKEACSQIFTLGNVALSTKAIRELKLSRKTISSMKKLQFDGVVYSINYRDKDPLTIERKITNIANIYYSFELSK